MYQELPKTPKKGEKVPGEEKTRSKKNELPHDKIANQLRTGSEPPPQENIRGKEKERGEGSKSLRNQKTSCFQPKIRGESGCKRRT